MKQNGKFHYCLQHNSFIFPNFVRIGSIPSQYHLPWDDGSKSWQLWLTQHKSSLGSEIHSSGNPNKSYWKLGLLAGRNRPPPLLFLAWNRYLLWVNQRCSFRSHDTKMMVPASPATRVATKHTFSDINSWTFPLQIQIIITKQKSLLAMRQKGCGTVEELRCVKRLHYLVRRWLTRTGTGYQQQIKQSKMPHCWCHVS